VIFLGGTCGNNDWRNRLFTDLNRAQVSTDNLYNPVVPDWTSVAQASEEKAKASAEYCVFYIANPRLDGVNISAFSMVEATMALYDSPDTTVVVFDEDGIEGHVLKAMQRTRQVLQARFPTVEFLSSYQALVDYLIVMAVKN